MELIRGLHNLRARHQGCVATIGAFDGVHRGHQELLRRLVAKGKALGLPSVVICFEPLPREYFAPKEAPARLMSFREKFAALRELGLDRVLRVRFTDKFSSRSAEDFINDVFVQGLGAKYIVVGDDLRFGAGRKGDANVLRRAGERFGFEVVAVPSILEDAQRISSTRIRQCLAEADFASAEALLGRPFTIGGKVIYGSQLGRTIGIPTANVELHRYRVPLSGVYVVMVAGAAQHDCAGVANVGFRPTIGDLIKAILEVHLLNFDRDIYGRHIKVRFLHKLREEQKFASLEQLKLTINNDIASAHQWLASQHPKL